MPTTSGRIGAPIGANTAIANTHAAKKDFGLIGLISPVCARRRAGVVAGALLVLRRLLRGAGCFSEFTSYGCAFCSSHGVVIARGHLESGVGFHSVFADVQAFDFFAAVHA
jgi:hypothetical protein